MANPSNAIGTNGAFGGRTSVNALNDVLATFTGAGVISGWAVAPSSGMTVQVGGQSGLRDVAIAEDNNGNRTTVDNISQAPVPVDIASAPSTNSRMDAIVGYVENPPQGSATVLDNPAACGIVAVSGTASSSPSAPTDSAIRTALTGLGINGATAYYAILGYVTVPSGTTDIDATMISAVPYTNLNTANNIGAGQISADKVDFATYTAALPATINASVNYSYVWYNLALRIAFVNINFQASANMPSGETTIHVLPDEIKDLANSTSAGAVNVSGCHAIIRAGGEVKVYLGSASRPRIYGQVMISLLPYES